MKLRLFLFLLALPCFGAAPPLEWIFPPIVSPGTNEVTLGGKQEKWPPGFWCSEPGISFFTGTNTGKVSIVVGPEVKPGPQLLRLYNPDGTSDPKAFLITNSPPTMEVETNDLLQEPQILSNKTTIIAGKLEKSNDIDFYQVTATKGHYLSLKLDGYSLGSPMDPLLHIYNSHGLRVAFNHDSAQSIDPSLIFRAPETGTYTIQVVAFENPPSVNVRFAGSSSSIYLLHVAITEEAPPPHPLLASLTEVEPNNSRTNGQPIKIPAEIVGTIQTNSDIDVFTFDADPKMKLEIEARGAILGSPIDLHLRLLNKDGVEVAKDDDGGDLADPKINFTPGNSNTFSLFVTDLLRESHSNSVYQLTIRPAAARFEAFVSDHKFILERGKTNDLKLELSRYGNHTNSLEATIEPLPPGITLLTNSSTSKDLTLKIHVPDDAPATNSAVQIFVHDKSVATTNVAHYRFRTEESKGDFLINSTGHLWLTIPEAKKQ